MQQNNYGGKNYQIKADSIGHVGDIYQSPNSPTGEELLHKGIQLINKRAYRQAIDVLNDAAKTDPLISDTYYYLAIALLSGEKPSKIDLWTIQSIEEKLNTAVCGNAKNPKYYMLWAIIKYGYYVMNGFIEKTPTSNLLFNQGNSIQTEDAREILYHLDDPKNLYWKHLNNKFGRAN